MDALLKKRRSQQAKLEKYSEFLRGSITSVCSTCNRAKCICKTPSTRKAYRLTYKDSQRKSRTLYLSAEEVSEVRRKIANYAKMRKIMEQLLETNIAIFKKRNKR